MTIVAPKEGTNLIFQDGEKRFVRFLTTFIGVVLIVLVAGCSNFVDESSYIFRHWVIDPHPNTGKDCCSDVLMLGDINSDGNLDVVIGSEKSETSGLVWYQYPTWEKHPVASGEFTTDGQLADIDYDGDLDIVIGEFSEGTGEILWYENTSGTGQGEWVRHEIGKGYTHDLVTGDVNGDGKMDIVTCDKKKVVFWEQMGPDSFQGHTIIEREGEGIALSDIDGDGDIDIVYGGSWLENSGLSNMAQWTSHSIAPKWSSDTRVFVADMNSDNRPDVVLSVSEGKGSVSWFESPENPGKDPWLEHTIEKGVLDGAHSLQVADIDGDDDLDVITAEMHTSWKKRVLFYRNEGESFIPLLLSRDGSHNMRVDDIDGDGDIDIVGKNYAGPGRVIEMWENISSKENKWEYISIDRKRPESQKGKMGLVFIDADGDSFTDVVAGSFLYINPKGNLSETWRRIELPDEVDVYFALDVDGDRFCDLIGINEDTVMWIEAKDEKAYAWKSHAIGKVVAGRTQGYIQANLIPGEKPQLIFARGKNLYVLEIPNDFGIEEWPLHHISSENEEGGLTAGDIDRDGDLDIASVHRDGHHVVWFENPGSLSVRWEMHVAGGQVNERKIWLDRVALADVNNDGRLDIIATEEKQDWKLSAHIYWFEAPDDPIEGEWHRHIIARHRSVNSMDIADVDGDGDIDIAIAEHTDQKEEGARDNITIFYLNRDDGLTWVPNIVERGPHSSHLGSRLADLDNDGFPEMISIGWGQYRNVHLWKKSVKGF